MWRKNSIEELTVEKVASIKIDEGDGDLVKRNVVPKAMQKPDKDSQMGTIIWKNYNFHSPETYANVKGMKATYVNS